MNNHVNLIYQGDMQVCRPRLLPGPRGNQEDPDDYFWLQKPTHSQQVDDDSDDGMENGDGARLAT
jgi:hypothetical protein